MVMSTYKTLDMEEEPSAGSQWAIANMPGGLEQYNQNIKNWFADPSAHTQAETQAAMQQYGISASDIQNATGRSLDSYYQATPSPQSKLAEQILATSDSSKWQGEGFGSAQANAADMARILSEIGVTDIGQFGEIKKTVAGDPIYAGPGDDPQIIGYGPEKVVTTYGNKATGQVVPVTYGERQTDNAWGGTFTGEGNTGYRVVFDEQGNPRFFTTGASSNSIANLLEDPLLNVVANIAASVYGGPAGVAALQAAQGKDVGDIAKSALLSYVGGEVANAATGAAGDVLNADVGGAFGPDNIDIGGGWNPATNAASAFSTEGLTNIAAKSIGNAAGQVVSSGGKADFEDALLAGSISTGANIVTNQIPGYKDLSPAAQTFVNNAVTSTIRNGGNLSSADIEKAAIAAGSAAVRTAMSDALRAGSTAGGITNRIYDDTITQAGADAFIQAKAAGASDEDALAAANSATGVATTQTTNAASSGQKDLGEFAGLDEAIQNNAMDDAIRENKLSQIGSQPKFSDAFAQARELLGPNQTFEWNGKQYSTATFAENPALSGNVVPGTESTVAGAGRGSYAGYSSVEDAASKTKLSNDKAAELLKYITDSEAAQYDALGNPIGGARIDGAPDLNTTSGKIANGVANAINSFTGIIANSPNAAVQAGSNLLSNAAGIIDLAAGKSTDIGNTLREQSGKIDSFVKSISDPEVQNQQKAIGKAIDDAEGFLGKTAALGSAMVDNPLGTANWILTEGWEEVPGVGLALKAGSRLATYGITSANDLMESGGAAYNDTYKAAIANGMPEQDARDAARNSALASMAATGVTQGLIEGKLLTKIAGKETVGEGVEGAAQTAAGQLALGQELNADAIIKGALIEAAVGKGASTSAEAMTATNAAVDNVSSTVAQAATSGDAAATAEAITSTIKSGVESGANVGSVVTAAVVTAIDNGADIVSAVDSAVSAGLNADASNASDVAGAVAYSLAASGADTESASIILSDALVNAGVDANSVQAIVSSAITNAESKVSSLTSGVDAATKTSTDANAIVDSKAAVDANANVKADVSADANTDVKTETKTDANTNTTTTTKTDLSNNTQVTTVVDNKTGEIVDTKTTEVPPGWAQTSTDNSKTKTPVKTSTSPEASLLAGAAFAPGFDWSIAPQTLKSTVTGGAIDPLAAVKQAQAELERDTTMQNIDPRLMQILQQRMAGQQPDAQGGLEQALQAEQGQPEQAYYSYGSEDSIDDILGGQPANYKEGGYVQPLMATGGSMALPLLAKSGGALGQYNGRENFKDGKHVAGEGDGQSDDIPAWLADGEFVFPADVVSALGNGSTKAGTDKLYEMMHNIRDHARSTGKKDLPPPALKSPLDYLKSHKRSK